MMSSSPPHDTRSAASSLTDAPMTTDTPGDIVVTRHPIFDTARRTIGYELLSHSFACRASQDDDRISDLTGTPRGNGLRELPGEISEGPRQTSGGSGGSGGAGGPGGEGVRAAIHQALHVIGLDALLGDARLFLPVTPQTLAKGDYLVLPPDRTCLKLPAQSPMTPALVSACLHARQAGYMLAVDQQAMSPVHHPIREMAQIMRAPLRQADGPMMPASRHTGEPAWLASQIDTQADWSLACELGARYVQGSFFARPQTMRSRELAGVETVRLRFLAELQKPRLDFARIEEIIKTDVALTCHLLRYLNSAAVGLRRKVTSIHQALLLLGERPLRQWGSLVALTALGSDQPHELVVSSLVRARFCEKLAARCRLDEDALDLFLIGLLSLLDALLGLPLDRVLASLPLNPTVMDTLVHQKPGPLRMAYDLACAAERGAWGSVIQLSNQLALPQHEIAAMYYGTMQWTQQLLSAPAQ